MHWKCGCKYYLTRLDSRVFFVCVIQSIGLQRSYRKMDTELMKKNYKITLIILRVGVKLQA